jgi:hypothetical protein
MMPDVPGCRLNIPAPVLHPPPEGLKRGCGLWVGQGQGQEKVVVHQLACVCVCVRKREGGGWRRWAGGQPGGVGRWGDIQLMGDRCGMLVWVRRIINRAPRQWEVGTDIPRT